MHRTLVVGLLLALAACGGKKEEPAPEVNLGAVRAKRDSARKADSLLAAKFTNCSDSVLAVLTKTPAGKKRVASAPTGMIQPEVLTACGKPPASPAAAPVVAATDSGAKPAAAPVAANDTGKKAPVVEAAKPGLTPQQQQVMRADSIRQARERARQDSLTTLAERTRSDSIARFKSDSARADSLRSARETEVVRETFTYSGGSRDPFASLITEDKLGPEFSDLILTAVYLDLRRASNSVAVLRDKTNQKGYKLRVGERLGRLKVAQIRQTDVVFTVEDIGFERQETLSLRKRETQTP
ncbi:MAG TPA: hypothetical protein VG817_00450 [Gemmatimonadales bacterium]|nr:hypothetical protein [Gemmatimonadales bacterium]